MPSSFLVKDPSVPENQTFYHDEKLPSLPVPEVKETIEKYLDSCRAILNDEDYEKTKKICQRFVEDDSVVLQEKLLERAAKRRNWLEQWWSEKVYLETRVSLPLQNFSGPGTYLEHVWPLKEGTQLERIALGTYVFVTLWDVLRKEMMAPHMSDGKYLTMNQFRYLFNTCRIPHKGKDELFHCFKTIAEGGNSPTHIIVLCQGYVFKIEAMDSKSGCLITPPQYFSIFEKIRSLCAEKNVAGPGVAALTGLNRDDWADAREHLCNISTANQSILNAIETALLVTSLDDFSPRNYSEISLDAMVGNPNLRWYDKSYSSISSPNGAVAVNCDHTPYDAMVIIALVEYFTFFLRKIDGVWPGPKRSVDFVDPIELVFDLDEKSSQSISKAKRELIAMRENLEIFQLVFCKFGKSALKKVNVHPDFMMQLCIQLAYMHTHGKPAPTYETAMTRQYYHGRTETCRTCTPEVVAFCRAFLSNPLRGSKEYRELLPMLKKAHTKFLSLMKECSYNRGCDRHLLGLLLICVENNLPIPELYTDKAFTATGGNGNFILSTSCVGYMRGQGAVAPMLENGYGFFYRINDEKIIYSVSAYNSCPNTSARQLCDSFDYYMCNVLHLLMNSGGLSKL